MKAFNGHLQGLALEARRLASTAAAQERDAAAREGKLAAAGAETAAVQSALADSQLALQQSSADIQASCCQLGYVSFGFLNQTASWNCNNPPLSYRQVAASWRTMVERCL